MKKPLLLLMVFCVFAFSGNAQTSLRPADLVDQAQQTKTLESFQIFEQETNPSPESRNQFQNFAELIVQTEALNSILEGEKEFIEFDLPVNNSETITLQLVQTDIYQGNDYVVEEPGMKINQINIGQHYRGIVKGNSQAFASLSFFEGEISGMVAGYKETNLVIGPMDNATNHIVYSDDQLMEIFDSECGVEDDGINYKEKDLEPNPLYETAALSDCVRLYVEVDYDIYQDKGSTQNVTNYITGMMNQVMTIYANENINTSLSPLVIWTQSSPYSSTSSSGMLSDFQSYRNSFDGDLGQLVSYQASGGIAAGFNGLCASNTDNKQSFSSIYSTYSNYPTMSYTVFVVAHEFGHLFGSRHTHACVWNGNGTAIDSCAGYTEGSCSMPGNPSGGGTIMSYCLNTSVGIDLTKGFGTQPGNVIRNRVSNANCLVECDGDPDPDPEPQDCVDSDFTLTITLDNYPEETSWTVTNSSGNTVASGGTYGSQPDGSTVTENFSLSDGDFTFTINDSYGDGICCSYGSGSYSLESSDGTTVASGGNFTSSEATEFCVESSGGDTQAPTTPASLTVTGTTETTVDLDWNNSSDNVGVAGYNVFMNGNNIGTVSNSSANVTGLTEATTYNFYVTAFDDAGNESSASNTVTATTDSSDPDPVTYCSSGGNNSSYEWIDFVGLNNLSNSSGNDGGYADYTNLTANLPYGSNTVTVSAGFSGSLYTEYWSVWIDYNQDGTFASSEEVISGSVRTSGNASGSFTVPSSAQSGTTRMRVQMKYGSDGDPCETFTYGEVEDYTVNIGSSYNGSGYADIGEPLTRGKAQPFTLYPNPARGGVTNIDVADFRSGQYTIMNSSGKIVQQDVFEGGRQAINVSNLPKGLYIIEVSNGERKLQQKLVIQ